MVLEKRKLTSKQKKFVALYDGNAAKTAILAGYSKKTARSIGQENLTKPDIMEAIKDREEKEFGPLIANRQERQKFWTAVLRGNTPDIKEVKIADRLRASELLGKSEADFTEKIQYEGMENFADLLREAKEREVIAKRTKSKG
jgi:phage terminase small subunit